MVCRPLSHVHARPRQQRALFPAAQELTTPTCNAFCCRRVWYHDGLLARAKLLAAGRSLKLMPRLMCCARYLYAPLTFLHMGPEVAPAAEDAELPGFSTLEVTPQMS